MKFRRSLLILIPLGVAVLTLAFVVKRNLEMRERLLCGIRMKSLGTAVKIYAEDNHVEPNEVVQILIDHGDWKAEDSLCPTSGQPILLAAISAARLADVSPRDVIAYEPLSYHDGKGANILYGDGHASFESPDAYREVIAYSKSAGSWGAAEDLTSNGS